MNTPTAEPPDLINLMEWNRFAEDRKTLLEALTILNNRHRTIVAELNQRPIERQNSFQAQLIRIEETWREKLRESQAQVVALRDALTQYREAFSDGPENCGCILWEKVDEIAAAALSCPPPPCVPLAEAQSLADALQSLRDEQNGPPLERHKIHWQEAYDTATRLLNEWDAKHPQPQTA